MLLAGDIGGTKTSLAVYEIEHSLGSPFTQVTYPSAQYESLEALVATFLAETGLPIEQAVFGVAGPVLGGRATITNLPWDISAEHLSRHFGFTTVHLLNDLEAIAVAIPVLGDEDLMQLHAGSAVCDGNIAVIAPGTGLGEAFLTREGAFYQAHPSEGGHSDFAPATPLQAELWNYLSAGNEHVSFERVCSGLGMPNLYRFLRDTGRGSEPEWLTRQLAQVSDPTPIIVNAALDRNRPPSLCIETLRLFASILGGEAGNLALTVMATGGVYVAGGIPPRILPFLTDGVFEQAFCRKGRLSSLVEPIPVYAVLNRHVALLGAAQFGLQQQA
jgi:glucokinase